MTVAVTIGVYNEEKNISALLESLLNQTRLPDEIIIADDGSKDNTAKIVREYAARYPRVNYIYRSNHLPCVSKELSLEKFIIGSLCLYRR